jgi:transcriptional regulator with GAF, ATPase, and Fis domain
VEAHLLRDRAIGRKKPRPFKEFGIGAETSALGAAGGTGVCMSAWCERLGKARAVAGWLRSVGGALVRQRFCRRRSLIVVAAFLVVGYAIGVLGYVSSTPEIGIRCAFTPVVNYFFPEFLYPPDQEPLHPGDTIVRLGNRPVDNWSQLLQTLIGLRAESAEAGDRAMLAAPDGPAHLRLHGQEVVRVDYLRGTDPIPHRVWCRLGPSPVEDLVPSILWFFIKIGLFVVGAIVFWKRPEDRSAAQFFLLCLVSFGAYMGGYHWSRIVTQPALLLVFMVCSVLLPPVSLHFYLLFPRPKGFLERRPRTVLLALYGPALVFLMLLLSGYLRIRWLNREGPADGVKWLLAEMLLEIFCYFGIAALFYLASLVSLIHSYRTAANPTERNQVKWILLGAGAAAVPIGYSLYLAFLDTSRFGGGAATWPMFAASACMTVAFTISITRYRLMQLDQLLSSGAVYFLISCVVGLVYYGLFLAGMVLLGIRAGEGPSLGQVLSVSVSALVLLVVLDLLRARFKAVLNHRFRREKHQLDRTLRRMSQAIEQLVDPPTLGRRLLHTSAELLGVGRGAVYLREGKPPLYRLADNLGPEPPLVELPPGCPLIEAMVQRGAVMAAIRGPADAAQRQLQFLGGGAAQALVHEGELLGLLVLGPRESSPYTPEDYNLLAAFAQVTVLALVSAEGHRTIEALNCDLQEKVEKIAEQQRRILALQSQLTRMGNGEWRMGTKEPSPPSPRAAPEPSSHSPFPIPQSPRVEGMIGSSPQVQQLLQLVRKVAASASAVLLRGESGTGKELLARAIHDNSPRAGRPFVKVHCAALSPTLLESELFGHVKGAFTNAIRDKVGRFESAHGGTLFLDEIGDVSGEVQVKLLRVLQEMTFERVGSSEPVKVDVRIIAATHQDLEALIRAGRFREDLYYRLNVLPIPLPPLRERVEDIPELVAHFLRLYGRRAGKEVVTIDDDALARLKAYPWPGNVRQLESVIDRAVVVAEKAVVTVDDLPPELNAGDFPAAAAGEGVPAVPAEGTNGAAVQAERSARERREREQMVRALSAAGGNKAEAARALGMARSTLLSRLKKLGLS